jgi:multidrug efflux system outer membrane protein
LNIQKAQQQYQISENNQLPTIGASGSAVRQVTLLVIQ